VGKGIGELQTFAIGVAVSSHTRVVALPMTRSRGMLYISWLMGRSHQVATATRGDVVGEVVRFLESRRHARLARG
jgi:hypothetical protein